MKTRKLCTIIGILAICVLGLAFVGCGNGEDGGDNNGTGPGTTGSGQTPNPVAPVISAHPQGATYDLNATNVSSLTVTATKSDGGTLSYQWYRNTANNNTGGTIISGGTNASFTPSATAKGVVYYYVIVTNTLNGKTANATSNTAGIGVGITTVKINSGLTVQSKVYDGTTTATVTGTAVLSGVDDGDVVTVIAGTVVFNDKNVGTDKAITFIGWSLGGANASNYMLSAQHEDITGEITAKSVTITGLMAQGKPYDGNTTATVAGTAVISGLISGDTVTATGGTAAFADKNVGTGKTVTFSDWSLTGEDAGNYSLQGHANSTAVITPKSVTITGLTVEDKPYDGNTTATVSGTAIVNGTIDGDTVTATGGTAAFANKNVGTGKTITLSGWSLTGTDAGNYSLSEQPENTTANITAKSVTITGLTVEGKEYDGNTTATVSGTAVVDGLISGDTVTATGGTAAFADKNVGTGITVTLSGWSLTGTDAGNYSLFAQPSNATANITAKSVTITGLSVFPKFYDNTTTATVSGTAVINGLISGDTVTATGGTATFADANIGNGKTVTFSGWSLTGTDAGNYSLFAQPNATANIIEAIAMVQINAGTFTMGSPETEAGRGSNETQHQVTLTRGFYMGKYQVTQEQYQAVVMGSNPSYFHGGTGREPDDGENQGKRPVEYVSWYDAIVFCNKLSIMEGLSPVYSISGSTDTTAWGTVPTSSNATWDAVVMISGANGYRLPTEAEWEYTCRAGTTAAFNNGNNNYINAVNVSAVGWYIGNANSKTHQVGLKTPNAWGLYDMHGNVYEWCWDWFMSYDSGAQIDPMGAVTGSNRVLRGGDWYDNGRNLRSAYRGSYGPNGRGDVFGFRLVRSLP